MGHWTKNKNVTDMSNKKSFFNVKTKVKDKYQELLATLGRILKT